MPEAEELLSSLRQMQLDPEMREFRPLIEELIAGIETPGYDNIELVWKCMCSNPMEKSCWEP